MDGWFSEEDSNQPSQRSPASPRQRPPFHPHKSSPFCSLETGVPGFVYKGLDYSGSQKPQPALTPASTPTHRQSCQINMQMGIENMFTEEFVQQSPFFQPDQSRPSSSSSSLRSLSVSSPEYSSFVLSTGNSLQRPDAIVREIAPMEQVTQPRSALQLVHPHQVSMQAYGGIHSQFPTPAGDVDAAMTRAMLAVLSSSSSSSSQQNQAGSRGGAFKPYDSSLFRNMEAKHSSRGQEMMKRSFSILRQIPSRSAEASAVQETRPTSNQLHHMISERKRREKLNESFAALRTVLPQGTKRDKASVLVGTIAYVNSLKAEISDLAERNRLMEARLLPQDGTDEADEADEGSGEIVRIIRAPESSSTLQQIELRVAARVEYCDMIDLVLHILEQLKKMRGINLVSLDASIQSPRMSPIRRAVLTIKIKGGDWDEDSFKGAIARAVDEALPRPETAAS